MPEPRSRGRAFSDQPNPRCQPQDFLALLGSDEAAGGGRASRKDVARQAEDGAARGSPAGPAKRRGLVCRRWGWLKKQGPWSLCTFSKHRNTHCTPAAFHPSCISPSSIPASPMNSNFPKSCTELRSARTSQRGSGTRQQSCTGQSQKQSPKPLGCSGSPQDTRCWARTPQQCPCGAWGSSSQPAPCPSLPFPRHGFDHLHVTALLLLAGKSRTRSMPTALFGDSPSHGKSHEWACTRRHDHVILPGHAAFRERCGQGREGPRMRARRHRAATGAGLDTRGCSHSLRPSRHNTEVLCAAEVCFQSCRSLRERCNLVGLEERNQRKRRNWRNPGQRPPSGSSPWDSLAPAGWGQRCLPTGPASTPISSTGRGTAGPWGQETGPQNAPRAAPAHEVPSGAHTHPQLAGTLSTCTSPLVTAALPLQPSPGRGRGDPAGSAP